MKIREIHKWNNGDYIEHTEVLYNSRGQKTFERGIEKEERFFYDKEDRLISAELITWQDDPNECQSKYKDIYEYSGYNYRVIRYHIGARAINDDWQVRDQIISIREVRFEGKNIVFDKTTYLGSLVVIYSKFKYVNDHLIYKEKIESDGSYVKTEYTDGKIILEEQKVLAHWEEGCPFQIFKTERIYDGNQICQTRTYVDNLCTQSIYTKYSNDRACKIERYSVFDSCEALSDYDILFYSDDGKLHRKETHTIYKEKEILTEYELYERVDGEEVTRNYTNQLFYDWNEMSNIDYCRAHNPEYWVNEVRVFGNKINSNELTKSMTEIETMFAEWKFDRTWEKRILKNDHGDVIKEQYKNPIDSMESPINTILHFEYNDHNDLEFVLKLNSKGVMSEISKYYHVY